MRRTWRHSSGDAAISISALVAEKQTFEFVKDFISLVSVRGRLHVILPECIHHKPNKDQLAGATVSGAKCLFHCTAALLPTYRELYDFLKPFP